MSSLPVYLSFIPAAALLTLLAQPLYILLMWGVLRTCGVPRKKAAEWALKQSAHTRTVALLHLLLRDKKPPGDYQSNGNSDPQKTG